MQNMDWYNKLNKPLFNPPSEIFMPVWIILYIMIFISLILFLRGGFYKTKIIPLIFFLIQIILNFSWTGIFFGVKDINFALVIIVLMWIFILMTIISFYRYSKASSIILIPYFLWVTFALYLN